MVCEGPREGLVKAFEDGLESVLFGLTRPAMEKLVDVLRAGGLSGSIATVLLSITTQSTCRKKRVACVLKLQNGTTFHAANGTLPGMPTCLEGGCLRCASDFSFRHGMNYDVCICVHMEAAAIGLGYRAKQEVRRSFLYSTYQPCIQ